jgi:DNA polymerase-3 subunit gamma/tau
MAAQALYRKWRSQTFDEIVGQEHIVQTLRNAIAEDRVAHAYLFTGPRGVGKTSMARLLAKAVNCTAPTSQRPCGECESCREIAEGRAVDVIEMDAASHTSVEDARDIIERIQFRPSRGRYKVYVIDEVHMLSTAAFNALLKTLEEPPGHALFILATTESHKVPATILSRCQRFTFSRHTITTTAAHLQRIANDEGVQLEPGVAETIARAATGSLRDALGTLEQLIAFSQGTLTLEQVQNLLGMSSAAEVYALVEALLDGDVRLALRAVHGIASQGADVRQFTRDLIERLRGLMLLIATGDHSLLDVGEDDKTLLDQWSNRADLSAVRRWIALFSSLDYQLRTSPYGHLPLELAVVEALTAPTEPAPAAPPAAAPAPAAPSRPRRSKKHPPPPPPLPDEPAPPPAQQETTPDGNTPPPVAPLTNEQTSEEEQETIGAINAELSVLEQVEAVWPRVVYDVRPADRNLEALLKSVHPFDIEGSTVVLLAISDFHKKQIEQPSNRKIVEEILSKHMGKPLGIRCTVEARTKKQDIRKQIQSARKDPLVKAAINIFGADIVRIEEHDEEDKE